MWKVKNIIQLDDKALHNSTRDLNETLQQIQFVHLLERTHYEIGFECDSITESRKV